MLFKLLPELLVTAAAASPDGRVFFTAHPNGEVRAWDVSSPGSPEWLAVPTGGVRGSVVLSADGARLLGRNLNDAAQGQWDFSWWQVAGSQVSSLGGYTIKTGNLSSDLIINPDLSRIALVDPVYGTARVIDSANGELIKQLELGPGANDVLINADGSQLLVSRSYGFVDAWDIATARLLYSFKIADVPDVKGQSFYEVLSKDGTLLLTWGSNDLLVRLWKADTGQFIKEFNGSNGTLCRPVITPDNQWLLTCGEDQTVLVWDVAAGKLARTIKLPDRPNLVQVNPGLRYIVAGLVSSQTVVYDFKSGRQTVTLPGSSSMGVSTGADYQFSPDGKYIWMTIPGDQTAYGFALENNQLVALACERLAAISLPVSQGGNAQLPICKTGAGKP
jgi:WD40 repeat protein